MSILWKFVPLRFIVSLSVQNEVEPFVAPLIAFYFVFNLEKMASHYGLDETIQLKWMAQFLKRRWQINNPSTEYNTFILYSSNSISYSTELGELKRSIFIKWVKIRLKLKRKFRPAIVEMNLLCVLVFYKFCSLIHFLTFSLKCHLQF